MGLNQAVGEDSCVSCGGGGGGGSGGEEDGGMEGRSGTDSLDCPLRLL